MSSEKHLIEQIAKGEHQQQDFKFEVSDSAKIAQSLSAFANTDGGRLLVGVKDNGRLAGVRSDEEFHMLEAASQMYTRPLVPIDVKQHKVEGKTLLEVRVEKGQSKPYLAPWKGVQWRAYIRVGDQNLLANGIQIEIWKRKKNPKPVKIEYRDMSAEKVLLDMLREEGRTTLSKFSRTGSFPLDKARSVIVDLALLNLVENVIEEQGSYIRLK